MYPFLQLAILMYTVQGALNFTNSSMEVQDVSLSNASNRDVQEVSISAASSMNYERAWDIPFHHRYYWWTECIHFLNQHNGRSGCITFHSQQYGRAGCLSLHRQQYKRAGCIPFLNAERYQNEQKYQYRNQSDTGRRGPSPVPECSDTGLR